MGGRRGGGVALIVCLERFAGCLLAHAGRPLLADMGTAAGLVGQTPLPWAAPGDQRGQGRDQGVQSSRVHPPACPFPGSEQGGGHIPVHPQALRPPHGPFESLCLRVPGAKVQVAVTFGWTESVSVLCGVGEFSALLITHGPTPRAGEASRCHPPRPPPARAAADPVFWTHADT